MRQTNWFSTTMTIIGPVGNLMFYVQAYEIFASRSAAAVSLSGFLISVFGLSSWLGYGIYLKNTPLIVANAVGVVGALLVVAGILRYHLFD